MASYRELYKLGSASAGSGLAFTTGTTMPGIDDGQEGDIHILVNAADPTDRKAYEKYRKDEPLIFDATTKHANVTVSDNKISAVGNFEGAKGATSKLLANNDIKVCWAVKVIKVGSSPPIIGWVNRDQDISSFVLASRRYVEYYNAGWRIVQDAATDTGSGVVPNIAADYVLQDNDVVHFHLTKHATLDQFQLIIGVNGNRSVAQNIDPSTFGMGFDIVPYVAPGTGGECEIIPFPYTIEPGHVELKPPELNWRKAVSIVGEADVIPEVMVFDTMAKLLEASSVSSVIGIVKNEDGNTYTKAAAEDKWEISAGNLYNTINDFPSPEAFSVKENTSIKNVSQNRNYIMVNGVWTPEDLRPYTIFDDTLSGIAGSTFFAEAGGAEINVENLDYVLYGSGLTYGTSGDHITPPAASPSGIAFLPLDTLSVVAERYDVYFHTDDLSTNNDTGIVVYYRTKNSITEADMLCTEFRNFNLTVGTFQAGMFRATGNGGATVTNVIPSASFNNLKTGLNRITVIQDQSENAVIVTLNGEPIHSYSGDICKEYFCVGIGMWRSASSPVGVRRMVVTKGGDVSVGSYPTLADMLAASDTTPNSFVKVIDDPYPWNQYRRNADNTKFIICSGNSYPSGVNFTTLNQMTHVPGTIITIPDEGLTYISNGTSFVVKNMHDVPMLAGTPTDTTDVEIEKMALLSQGIDLDKLLLSYFFLEADNPGLRDHTTTAEVSTASIFSFNVIGGKDANSNHVVALKECSKISNIKAYFFRKGDTTNTNVTLDAHANPKVFMLYSEDGKSWRKSEEKAVVLGDFSGGTENLIFTWNCWSANAVGKYFILCFTSDSTTINCLTPRLNGVDCPTLTQLEVIGKRYVQREVGTPYIDITNGDEYRKTGGDVTNWTLERRRMFPEGDELHWSNVSSMVLPGDVVTVKDEYGNQYLRSGNNKNWIVLNGNRYPVADLPNLQKYIVLPGTIMKDVNTLKEYMQPQFIDYFEAADGVWTPVQWNAKYDFGIGVPPAQPVIEGNALKFSDATAAVFDGRSSIETKLLLPKGPFEIEMDLTIHHPTGATDPGLFHIRFGESYKDNLHQLCWNYSWHDNNHGPSFVNSLRVEIEPEEVSNIANDATETNAFKVLFKRAADGKVSVEETTNGSSRTVTFATITHKDSPIEGLLITFYAGNANYYAKINSIVQKIPTVTNVGSHLIDLNPEWEDVTAEKYLESQVSKLKVNSTTAAFSIYLPRNPIPDVSKVTLSEKVNKTGTNKVTLTRRPGDTTTLIHGSTTETIELMSTFEGRIGEVVFKGGADGWIVIYA